MKLTFVSAALSVTAIEAAKLQRHFQFEQPADLVQMSDEALSQGSIMQSVKSLEQAYEFHKHEEQLLNDINGELAQYWKQAQSANGYISAGAGAKTTTQTEAKNTIKAKIEAKTNAKADTKSKGPSMTPLSMNTKAVQAKTAVKATDKSGAPPEKVNAELDDQSNLMIEKDMENEDYVQIDDQAEGAAGQWAHVDDPRAEEEVDIDEAEYLKSQGLCANGEKCKTEAKVQAPEAVDNKVQVQETEKLHLEATALSEAEVLAKSAAAEQAWLKEMADFKALEQANARTKAQAEAKADALVQQQQQQKQRAQQKLQLQASVKQQAIAKARTDIAQKVKAAQAAAAQAASLAKQVTEEAKLIEDNSRGAENQQTQLKTEQKVEVEQKKAPLMKAKFVQLPRYAFTTDLS